jgi:hypothetical protein
VTRGPLSSPLPPLLACSSAVATSPLSPPLSQLLPSIMRVPWTSDLVRRHPAGELVLGRSGEVVAWPGESMADAGSRWCSTPVLGDHFRPPPNRSEPRGRRDRRTPARDEGRIQTGPGRPISLRCHQDLRLVHHRFVLSFCLLAVGFGAVAGEGYSEI